MVHAAAFLGFELAFSKESNPFPKSSPRAVTILSINTAERPIPPLRNAAQRKRLTPPVEKTDSKNLVQTPKDSPELIPTDNVIQQSISGNSNVDYSFKNLSSRNPGNPAKSFEGKERPITTDPVPVRKIVPVYPFRARKKGHEGDVTLDVLVSSKGVPLSCSISDSSGFKELDKTARDAVIASLFYPGTVNGDNTESTLQVHISFRLKNS